MKNKNANEDRQMYNIYIYIYIYTVYSDSHRRSFYSVSRTKTREQTIRARTDTSIRVYATADTRYEYSLR